MAINSSEVHWWSERFSLLSEQRRFHVAADAQATRPADQPVAASSSNEPQALVGALYSELLCTPKSPKSGPAQELINVQPITAGPPNILSAEVYDEKPGVENSRRRVLRQHSDEACGHLISQVVAESYHGPEELLISPANSLAQSQVVTRAASPSRNTSPPNKKPRGRPRVETQNETAADRRRTQIRLAQRAYRLRKESTITSLRDRIAILEDTIDSMNQAFLQLHDHAIGSGVIEVYQEWGQKLKQTTQLFISLARKSRDESGEADEEAEADQDARDDTSEGIEAVDGSASISSRGRHGATAVPKTTDDSSRKRKRPAHPKPALKVDGPAAGSRRLLKDANSADVPDRADTVPPVACLDQIIQTKPYTFSVQETTFARRLQRRSWERGYNFLLNPDVPDADKARIFFRLDFCKGTKEQLISDLRGLLTRTTDESLDCIEGFTDHRAPGIVRPYLRTHNTELFRNADSWLVRSTERRAIASSNHTPLDISGYEGEWFDPADVENYLRRKGVHFSGQASYAEVELTDESYPGNIPAPTDCPSDRASSTSRSSSNPTASIPSVDGTVDDGASSDPTPIVILNDTSVNHELHQDVFDGAFDPLADVNAFFGFGYDYNLANDDNSIIQQQQLRRMNEKRIRTMTLDITLLLDEISKHGICLGGAPGFRQHDIDSAMRVALQVS